MLIQEVVNFSQLIRRPSENDVIYSVIASDMSAFIAIVSGVWYQMRSSHVVLLTTDKIFILFLKLIKETAICICKDKFTNGIFTRTATSV